MSFITRCPSCDTAFKVVSDQLKISDGWVRCGQCQHVFDATLDLQPWWPGVELVDLEAPARQTPSTPVNTVLPESSLAQEPLNGVLAAEPDPAPGPWLSEDGPKVLPESSERPLTVDAEAASSWHEPMYVDEMAGYTPPVTHGASSDASDWPSLSAVEPSEVGATPSDLAHELSFMRHAQRKAFWRRPVVRVALASVASVLSLLLAMQWAVLQRDALVTLVPALQPVLATVCQPLGCQVHAGQRLDQFAIDSSALLRRGVDRFAFDMVLKNAASQSLTPPSLELTLTDAQDKVVVRRVFAPAEWPQAPLVLPAQAEYTVRLELALDALPEQPVVGYRAILFYP